MPLRRGFKSEANEIAREVRAELGIAAAAPLDVIALAGHLAIPVLALAEFRHLASHAVDHFRTVDPGALSALTVFDGMTRVFVFNDVHSRGRQASDLAHEIAHALLMHRPARAIDDAGKRNWDAAQEEEAAWLAGALLVSEEAALRIASEGISLPSAAADYTVSEFMIRYRLNVTGAARRVARWRRPATGVRR
jgi:hypothetical protein